MARRRSAERQVFHFLEIKPKEPVELAEGKMMHMGLLAGKPLPAKYFPAPMQVIIQWSRADVHARRLFLQNPMDFPNRDRWIRQMFQHLRHHDDVEALIAEIDRGCEVHFVTGDARRARGLESELIDVDADPGNDIDEVN